jgi:hypothetical protein
MTDLLKFENIKEGDMLVSPWGSTVRVCPYDYPMFIRLRSPAFSDFGNYLDVTDDEFEAYFGGWKVKE